MCTDRFAVWSRPLVTLFISWLLFNSFCVLFNRQKRGIKKESEACSPPLTIRTHFPGRLELIMSLPEERWQALQRFKKWMRTPRRQWWPVFQHSHSVFQAGVPQGCDYLHRKTSYVHASGQERQRPENAEHQGQLKWFLLLSSPQGRHQRLLLVPQAFRIRTDTTSCALVLPAWKWRACCFSLVRRRSPRKWL